ncbi:MAG: hypothetical protein LBT14_05365 [Treponema sp.]|jgi:hypothetical protein|nr:hypothetical protein [Treponema sp.]
MAINYTFRLWVSLFLLVGSALYAQAPGVDRLMEHFIQRLTWEPVEFAYYYEVVVERLDDSGAESGEVVREITTEPVLVCSLAPGQYRYQVLVYNLLGRPEIVTAWAEFEVLPAVPKGFYYEERTATGVPFIQRLTWESVASGYYYEAVVEQQDDFGQGYKEVLRRVTKVPVVECSLAPGQYRYQVLVYNRLGRIGARSEWAYFEVRSAIQPAVVHFTPNHFYLDKDTQWVLTVTGRNLTEESELSLRSQTNGTLIVPLHCNFGPSGGQAQLVFNPQQLIAGRYDVVVKNPGGLESSVGTFRISNSPLDIAVSAAYSPVFPIYGDFNTLYKRVFFPAGTFLRLGLIPFKGLRRAFGFELVPSWNYLASQQDDFTVHAHLLGFNGNGVFQQWFFNRVLALNIRAGGGVSLVYDFYFEFDQQRVSEPVSTWIFSVNGGVSLQWFIRKPFFAELGVEFVYIFSVDEPPPAYIRPAVGVGWRF